eukprot:CAMPEP_0171519212 /NCGR_PEP_ID=MMETSP0959-20130129/5757_1 /TAXON_ID=87120 /ORGANISM="Aurantiochytrium limacinum, Strain ATCCMYA-1381" /LENGTH=35 /DNA_ID= /DNA_START= /DNA_END= /DNA_ORIENTATION=
MAVLGYALLIFMARYSLYLLFLLQWQVMCIPNILN